MTAETLHDALNLLPGDLITATDRLRTAPRKTGLSWKRWIPIAACLALLLSWGAAAAWQGSVPDRIAGLSARKEAAPEAPAAMAPVPENQKVTADAAAPEAPAEEAAGSETGTEEYVTDHSHRFAEPAETDSTASHCGTTTVTIHIAGERFTLSGSDAIAITDILIHLNYDPATVCRCMTDITVDTETLTGIQLDPVQGFARCRQGQAALTEEQAGIILEILEKLQ